jgi:hypothetical protein
VTITEPGLTSTIEEIPGAFEGLLGGRCPLGQQTPLHDDEFLNPR